MDRRIAVGVLVALFVGAVALVGIEFANGAADAGALAVRDPCEPRSAFPGQGLDATLQRLQSELLRACQSQIMAQALHQATVGHTPPKPILAPIQQSLR